MGMVNYIGYLNYWRKYEYARHLRFPQCLVVLDLLKSSKFREAICNQTCARFIEDQILLHWQFYNRKRGKIERQTDNNNKPSQKLATPIKNGSEPINKNNNKASKKEVAK